MYFSSDFATNMLLNFQTCFCKSTDRNSIGRILWTWRIFTLLQILKLFWCGIKVILYSTIQAANKVNSASVVSLTLYYLFVLFLLHSIESSYRKDWSVSEFPVSQDSSLWPQVKAQHLHVIQLMTQLIQANLIIWTELSHLTFQSFELLTTLWSLKF